MSGWTSELDSDGAELHHGVQSWGFIALFGFLLPALALQSLWAGPRSGDTWLAVATLLPAPLAWALLAEARMRIRVSAEGLEARPFWGRPVRERWERIRSVRYRKAVRVLELEAPGLPGGRLRISVLRRNVGVLASFIRDRVPEEALQGEARTLFRRHR